MDFSQYLEKCQDQLLAKVLLEEKLLDTQTLQQAYLEKKQQTTPCPLGQWLIRQRRIKIQDYTKVMAEVRLRAEKMFAQLNQNEVDTTAPTASFMRAIESSTPNMPPQAKKMDTQAKMPAAGTSRGDTKTSLPASKPKTQTAEKPKTQVPETRVPGMAKTPATRVTTSGTSSGTSASQATRLQAPPVEEAMLAQNGQPNHTLSLEDLQATQRPVQGARLGSYEILEEVARGGMGIIYRARQMYMNRIVALKVLLSGGAASELEIKRFHREAESAASLQHPNIISIYEIGEQNGIHFFTMDFIEGETFQALIKKKGRAKPLIKILIKVANALDYAHQHGIIHRDIKPSNILISSESEPKLMDFGLAKQVNEESVIPESSTLGTPYYMAPEQILGSKDLDGRADIYSMGVILYEILAHRLPFHAGTIMELYHRVMDEDPWPPSKWNKKTDYDIETVCLKAMSKNAQDRYASAKELADDLERYCNGEPILAQRLSWWCLLKRRSARFHKIVAISIIVMVLVVGLGVFFGLRFLGYTAQYQKQQEAMVLVQEGKQLLTQKNIETARQKFSQALQLAPEYEDAYLGLGDAYLADKQPHRALPEYEHALQANPKLAAAHLGRGNAYIAMENWDKAIVELDQALKKDPEFLEAYYSRSIVWQAQKNFDKACEDLSKSDQLKKQIINRGNIFFSQKLYEQAIQDYQRVLVVAPDNYEIYYKRGRAYFELGKYPEAIADFSQAIQVSPNFADAYSQRSITYYKIGKNKEGMEDSKKFQELQKRGSQNPK